MEQAPSIEQRISNIFAAEEAPEAQETPIERQTPVANESTEIDAQPEAKVEAAPEEVEIQTLSELAEAIGVDVEDLYNIKLPVDVDGQGREEITLGKWKDNYRESKVIESKMAELEKRRTEIDTLHKQKVEEFERREKEAADMLGFFEQQLFQQYAGVDWNELRQSDPGQWAALSFQLEQQKQHLAQLRATAAMKWDNARREMREAESARDREIATQEMQQVMELIPEWKDITKFESETSQIKAFLLSRGFNPQEIASARLKTVLLARDAMKAQALTQQANSARAKVLKLGKKVLQPGARTGANQQSNERDSQLRAKLKKSGDYKVAAALISERLKG